MRYWKWGWLTLLVLALLTPGLERVRAASPETTGLETRMALDLTGKDGSLPNSHVGGLASNGEFYLYAGRYAALYRSEDGLHWRDVQVTDSSVSLLNGLVRRLIWDGQQFVLLLDNRILVSRDGLDWQGRTPAHPNPKKEYLFRDVVYANGQYVILAQDRDRGVTGFYSPGDNTIFVGRSLSELKRAEKRDLIRSLGAERPLEHIVWNGSMYMAGGNAPAHSTDGKVWEGGDGLDGGGAYNAVWDGAREWEADGESIYSYDSKGKTRKIVYTQPQNSKTGITLTSIGYNGRSYIAAGSGANADSPTMALYSRDGAKWSAFRLGDEASAIHTILPTPYGYLLAGDRIWYVSETAIEHPSAWAAPELGQAAANKLTSYAVDGFYQSNISRQDFSILAVKLYEALTGRWAEAPQTNPFRDTVHTAVLKANGLGIINGQSASVFAPAASITRQDMAVTLCRTLEKAGLTLPTASSEWQADYADRDRVAPYAEEALRFLNEAGIIGGRSADRLDPTGTATREESVVMANRLYERFKDQIEAYTGPGSVGRTVFVPDDIGNTSEVTVIKRAINLDGRFVWSGEAIVRGDEMYVPLDEVAEPLGIRPAWDGDEYKLTLSKVETDFASQTDTGIGEDVVAAPQPRTDQAQGHRLRYRIGETDASYPIYVYRNHPYVWIRWLTASMGWDYERDTLTGERSVEYDALHTPGVTSTYFYWDQDDYKGSWSYPGLKVGERYLFRFNGGWNARTEVKVVTGEAANVAITPLPTGWMLTASKPGEYEIRIGNLDADKYVYTWLTVE